MHHYTVCLYSLPCSFSALALLFLNRKNYTVKNVSPHNEGIFTLNWLFVTLLPPFSFAKSKILITSGVKMTNLFITNTSLKRTLLLIPDGVCYRQVLKVFSEQIFLKHSDPVYMHNSSLCIFNTSIQFKHFRQEGIFLGDETNKKLIKSYSNNILACSLRR